MITNNGQWKKYNNNTETEEMLDLPTNSANNALGKWYFFDESSLMPNVYLNPAIA